VGLGISRKNADSSGIQFTTHFIEFLAVETKRFVGSFVNVKICGQLEIITDLPFGFPINNIISAASARAGLRKANAER